MGAHEPPEESRPLGGLMGAFMRHTGARRVSWASALIG